MNGLSQRDMKRVQEAIRAEVSANPPRIGVVGVSGVGKSSTINAMFKTNLAVSHARACTKEFLDTPMQLRMLSGIAEADPVSLIVVDAPGLGEDIHLDPGYLDKYQRQLPKCDVILWILTARSRAMSLDQSYLHELSEYVGNMVFAVNQVDLVHPMDWNDHIGLPSRAMEENTAEIAADRADKLAGVLGRRPAVTAYSASRGFNLEQLFAMLLAAIPEQRRFIYDGLKNFSYMDFVPAELQKQLAEGVGNV